MQVNMAYIMQLWQNGLMYEERFIGNVEDKEVSLADYEDFHDSYNQIGGSEGLRKSV